MTGRSFRFGYGLFLHSPFYHTKSGLSFTYLLYLNNAEKMIEYKFWIGDCLSLLRRYREALAELFSLSQMKSTLPKFHFSGLNKQLSIASDIPIEYGKIQRIIRECYDFVRQNGMSGSESMILLNESFLSRYRYNYERALSLSMEGFAKYNGSAAKYTKISHYNDVMSNLTALKRLAELKEWFVKLQNLDTSFAVSKQLHTLHYQAEIALLEGNPKAAHEFAVRRLRRDRETGGDCYSSLRLIIRTGIAAGERDSLPEHLIAIARLRNSEDGHCRYTVQKLFGEYYAARYKRGRRASDLSAARRCLLRALKIGTQIDRLLECDGRQKEIAELLGELG